MAECFETKSDFDHPAEYYDNLDNVDSLRQAWRMAHKSAALFDKRWQAAKSVIDAIARCVGIDPETCGLFLYAPDNASGESEMVRRLDSWFDHSGDKVRLKKRIDELERENATLRSIIREDKA